MKKLTASLIVLGGCLFFPQAALADPFRVAADYNVFVFGDVYQVGTDVQGRVAAGGNVTYGNDPLGRGFSAASETAPGGPAEIVAGGNVTLENGSVGNGSGNIVYGGTASIAPNVGYGMLTNGQVIDFAAEQSYLTSLSAGWGSLASNGFTSVLPSGTIELRGTDSDVNVFTLQASDIGQHIDFRFYTPLDSTVLVNVTGNQASLMNFGFFYNDVAGEPHTSAFPYSNIVFNFLEATSVAIDYIAINGSVLAPWANIDLGTNSHIDGQLIAASLIGNGESHDMPFEGDPMAVPEPGTMLLVASGLGMAAWRKRRQAVSVRGGTVEDDLQA